MMKILLSLGVFLVAISPLLLFLWWKHQGYTKSVYRKETGYSFWKVMKDAGLRGEFFTANVLFGTKGRKRLLLNLYLPKARGAGLTEIDLVCIHETGIYVVESKNFSGLIYGKEEDRNWTQVLNPRTKFSFYNPIKQNNTHINALQKKFPDISPESIHSLIVFSERCQLRTVSPTFDRVYVWKREALKKQFNRLTKDMPILFSKEQVEQLYEELKKHANVSEEMKEAHIQSLQNYQKA